MAQLWQRIRQHVVFWNIHFDYDLKKADGAFKARDEAVDLKTAIKMSIKQDHQTTMAKVILIDFNGHAFNTDQYASLMIGFWCLAPMASSPWYSPQGIYIVIGTIEGAQKQNLNIQQFASVQKS